MRFGFMMHNLGAPLARGIGAAAAAGQDHGAHAAPPGSPDGRQGAADHELDGLGFLKILRGQAMAEAIPNDSMSIIDVRDLAELHVSCAELPEASGRHFGVNRSFPWEEILASLERACPGYRKPPRFEGEAAVPTQFDFTRRDSLGVALRSLDETLADLVAFFRARGELA